MIFVVLSIVIHSFQRLDSHIVVCCGNWLSVHHVEEAKGWLSAPTEPVC